LLDKLADEFGERRVGEDVGSLWFVLNPQQSGFQPTVEPTGFQSVVVQFYKLHESAQSFAQPFFARIQGVFPRDSRGRASIVVPAWLNPSRTGDQRRIAAAKHSEAKNSSYVEDVAT
jgi:hypothetical protein